MAVIVVVVTVVMALAGSDVRTVVVTYSVRVIEMDAVAPASLVIFSGWVAP